MLLLILLFFLPAATGNRDRPMAARVMQCDNRSPPRCVGLQRTNMQSWSAIRLSSSCSFMTRCTNIYGVSDPDEALDAIVSMATKLQKPWVVVPCCVFRKTFVHRRLPGGQQVPTTRLCGFSVVSVATDIGLFRKAVTHHFLFCVTLAMNPLLLLFHSHRLCWCLGSLRYRRVCNSQSQHGVAMFAHQALKFE